MQGDLVARKKDESLNLNTFDNIEDINRFLNKVVHDMMSSIADNRGVGGTPQPSAPSYSFSVRIDHNGIPVISSTGQKSAPQQAPKADASHSEPLVDIIEASGTTTIIVEAHGLSKSEVSAESDGTTLSLKLGKGEKGISKSLKLPSAVNQRRASARLHGGILEIVLQKAVRGGGKSANIVIK